MLIGSIVNWERQREVYPPNIAQAVEALIELTATNPEVGKYAIDGDRLFINVMELTTKAASEQVAECHRKYIDVQLLLEGDEEVYGWTILRDDAVPQKVYDDEVDYALYAPSDDEVSFSLKPGMFVVFYPHDVHRPCMGHANWIKKAVAKVQI